MARAAKGMGKDTAHPGVGTADTQLPDEHDLGGDLQGKNKLKGNDQSAVRNQRPNMPEELGKRPRGPAQPRSRSTARR
jgi:hypothetical protein